MKIKTGDPVIITNGAGLEEHGIKKGDKGWANSVTTIPGDGTYVFYLPEDRKEVFVMKSDRMKYDKSRDGLELSEKTISKGD